MSSLGGQWRARHASSDFLASVMARPTTTMSSLGGGGSDALEANDNAANVVTIIARPLVLQRPAAEAIYRRARASCKAARRFAEHRHLPSFDSGAEA